MKEIGKKAILRIVTTDLLMQGKNYIIRRPKPLPALGGPAPWLDPVRKDPGQLVWPVNTPYG
ncbi:MAG: hypothetical protein WD708_07590, partial [Kiritimatiellia bacterium]